MFKKRGKIEGTSCVIIFRFYVVGNRASSGQPATCQSGYEYIDLTPCGDSSVVQYNLPAGAHVSDGATVNGYTLYQDRSNTQLVVFENYFMGLQSTCLGNCQGHLAAGLNPEVLTNKQASAMDFGPRACF